jgi:hypothetical protein
VSGTRSRRGRDGPSLEVRRVAARYVTPPSDLDPVERALTYPYEAPAHDYVFRGGRAERVAALTAADRRDRVPVLAFGSNRAPAQLARKFARHPRAVIPVERAFLADFDVVFAPHISGYAAIPAALIRAPGTRVEVAVTWLARELLPRMHKTEGAGVFYDWARLTGIALRSAAGERRGEVFFYRCRAGCLAVDGRPRALAAVPAAGRRLASLEQRDAQRAVMAKLGVAGTVEDFVRQNADDEALRLERDLALWGDALPIGWDGVEVLKT